MSPARRRKLVLLGIMSRYPVAGVVWQYVNYLVGFERLGYEAYYVEAGGRQPSSMLAVGPASDGSQEAAAFIDGVLRRFDLGGRWAFHALHSDGRCYGLTERQLRELYASADLIVNLHGATVPLPEHAATDRLIYLETDPVARQIELHQGRQETIDFLEPHRAFFTFGERYGQPDCGLPVSDRFHFRPTRQPVVVDFWGRGSEGPGEVFTSIGNWQQHYREVTFNGEVYHWSKHHEFLKILDLPSRTDQPFELALSRCGESDRRLLEDHGWRVRDALSISTDMDIYRDYVVGSRGELTVAKDQNVRLRSGWFSDRSATYLAAGRPVITQETGFSNVLPTGAGLFAFSSMDEILEALAAIDGDYDRHARVAASIARECFGHDVVLGRLLEDVGL
jgi:hypothetical protein